MTEITSKHGQVSRSPFELYMMFVDLRNFLQFLPEDKRDSVTADYDTLTATVQGFKIGVMVKERVPYSKISFVDDGAPFSFSGSLDADLAGATKSAGFKKAFPERFFDMGIAEADMVSTAAGLASAGKIPFASSFSVFIVDRALDQVRNSVCYPRLNVKLVGSHAGPSCGEDGGTHQAMEDIAVMRSLPEMCVVVPAAPR